MDGIPILMVCPAVPMDGILNRKVCSADLKDETPSLMACSADPMGVIPTLMVWSAVPMDGLQFRKVSMLSRKDETEFRWKWQETYLPEYLMKVSVQRLNVTLPKKNGNLHDEPEHMHQTGSPTMPTLSAKRLESF